MDNILSNPSLAYWTAVFKPSAADVTPTTGEPSICAESNWGITSFVTKRKNCLKTLTNSSP